MKRVLEILQKYRDDKQYILAGGLAAGNVRQDVRYFWPDVADVSSGVEDNGKKSKEIINNFIRKVRENEQ